MERAEYLARYRAADLFLDTLPYNAGTTASDALWAGLPVLTCEGESFASRMCASVLHSIDLPELITQSTQAYEAKAIELASDRGLLEALKFKLKQHIQTAPLFDTVMFCQHLEKTYQAMHDRSQAGLASACLELKSNDNA
jgi:predicted O-linked N-acetylglucosamine transferase (SPINDLY family)